MVNYINNWQTEYASRKAHDRRFRLNSIIEQDKLLKLYDILLQ